MRTCFSNLNYFKMYSSRDRIYLKQIKNLKNKLQQVENEKTKMWIEEEHKRLDESLTKAATEYCFSSKSPKQKAMDIDSFIKASRKRGNASKVQKVLSKQTPQYLEKLFETHGIKYGRTRVQGSPSKMKHTDGLISLEDFLHVICNTIGALVSRNDVNEYVLPFLHKRNNNIEKSVVDYYRILRQEFPSWKPQGKKYESDSDDTSHDFSRTWPERISIPKRKLRCRSASPENRFRAFIKKWSGHNSHRDGLGLNSLLRETFARFDTNRSGKISRNELREGLKKLNIHATENELEELHQKFDLDGDGLIDYGEFIRFFRKGSDSNEDELSDDGLMITFPNATRMTERALVNDCIEAFRKMNIQPNTLRTLFKNYDHFNSRKVSRKQFQSILKDVGLRANNDQLKYMSDYFDFDGTGRIEYEPFIQIVTSNHKGTTEKDGEYFEVTSGSPSSLQITDEDLRKILLQIDSWTLRRCFHNKDSDKTGVISTEDFVDALRICGVKAPRSDMRKIASRFMTRNHDRKGVEYSKLVAFLLFPNTRSPDWKTTWQVNDKGETSYNTEINSRSRCLQKVLSIIRNGLKQHGNDSKKYLMSTMRHYDKNHTGMLHLSRFLRILKGLGIKGLDCRDLEVFDTNKHNEIDYKQALGFILDYEKLSQDMTTHVRTLIKAHGFRTKVQMQSLFLKLDENELGRVIIEDFMLALLELGIEEPDLKHKILKRFKCHESAEIDYISFINSIFPTSDYKELNVDNSAADRFSQRIFADVFKHTRELKSKFKDADIRHQGHVSFDVAVKVLQRYLNIPAERAEIRRFSRSYHLLEYIGTRLIFNYEKLFSLKNQHNEDDYGPESTDSLEGESSDNESFFYQNETRGANVKTVLARLQKLVMLRNSTLEEVFKKIDKNDTNTVSSVSLIKGLRKHFNIFLRQEEATTLLLRFPSYDEDRLDYKKLLLYLKKNSKTTKPFNERTEEPDLLTTVKSINNSSKLINKSKLQKTLEKKGFDCESSLIRLLLRNFSLPGGEIDLDGIVEHLSRTKQSQSEETIKLKRENKNLRREMKAFSPEFFEEIEDLKYGYKAAIERNSELETHLWKLCLENNGNHNLTLPPPPPLDYQTKRIDTALSSALRRTIHGVGGHTYKSDLVISSANNLKPSVASQKEQVGDRLRNVLNPRTSKELVKTLHECDIDNQGLVDAGVFRSCLQKILRLRKEDIGSIAKRFLSKGGELVEYKKFLVALSPLITSRNSIDNDEEMKEPEEEESERNSDSAISDTDSDSSVDRYMMKYSSKRKRPTRINTDPPSYIKDDNVFALKNKLRSLFADMALETKTGCMNLRKTFSALDTSEKGWLCRNDLKSFLKEKHLYDSLSKTEMKCLFSDFDRNSDDHVDFEDFQKIFSDWSTPEESDIKKTIIRDRVQLGFKQNLRESFGKTEYVFDKYDKHGDGKLTLSELKAALAELQCSVPLSETEIEELFEVIDTNNDGRVSYDEFLRFANGPASPSSRKQQLSAIEDKLRQLIQKMAHQGNGEYDLRNAFYRFDTNGSGVITTKEFMASIENFGFNLSQQEKKTLITYFDSNNDGFINFREFLDFFKGTGHGEDAQFVAEKARISKEAEADALVLENKLREKLKRLMVGPDLTRQFSRFDRNHSGELSYQEFERMVNSLGFRLQPFERKWLIGRLDSNRSGKITFSEFSAFVDCKSTPGRTMILTKALRKVKASASNLQKCFHMNDIDANGFLNMGEFKRALHGPKSGIKLDDIEIEALFKEFDKSGDGQINLGEFMLGLIDRGKIIRQWKKQASRQRPGIESDLTQQAFRQALKRFDVGEKGYMSKNKLLRVCNQLGILSSKWEIEVLLRTCEHGDKINLDSFVDVLYDEEHAKKDGNMIKGESPRNVSRRQSRNKLRNSTRIRSHRSRSRSPSLRFTYVEESPSQENYESEICSGTEELENLDSIEEISHNTNESNRSSPKTLTQVISASKGFLKGDAYNRVSKEEGVWVTKSNIRSFFHEYLGQKLSNDKSQLLFELLDVNASGKLWSRDILTRITSFETTKLSLEIDEETDPTAVAEGKAAEEALKELMLTRVDYGTKLPSLKNLKSAFRFLNREDTGELSHDDIKEMCSDLGFRLDPYGIQQVLFRMCHKSVRKFSEVTITGFRFSSFIEWLFPIKSHLKESESRFHRAVRDSARTGGGGYDITRFLKRIDPGFDADKEINRNNISIKKCSRLVRALLPHLASSPEDVWLLSCRFLAKASDF